MNTTNSVEFTFQIQDMEGRNIVKSFIQKAENGFVAKGWKNEIDYKIEVKLTEPPRIEENKKFVGGGTDSTFPYNVFENFFDYIDNNVRVIKPENIQTDEYQKTADVKKRTLDGLFGKPIEVIQEDNEIKTSENRINKWDDLFGVIDTQKKENKTDGLVKDLEDTVKDATKSLDDMGYVLKNNYTTADEDSKNKRNVDDIILPQQKIEIEKYKMTQKEEEYTVVIMVKREHIKMCVSGDMGKRELMKLFS
jgi:hypothetical protein